MMNKNATQAINKLMRLLFFTANTLMFSLSSFADDSHDGDDVSNLDFSGTPHANSSWIGVTAVNTVFSNSRNPTDYTNSNFASANLTNASFIDATLSGANFTNANLNYVSFVDALLDGADFTNSIITNTNMGKVVVRGFTKEQLYSTASYKNKDLTGIWLANNNLKDWNFAGQNLTNVSFYSSDLTDANFTDSIITGTDFWRISSLTEHQFYSTLSYKIKNLSGINMEANVLSGWNFSGQNLTNANFDSAKLIGTNFAGANLTNVNFAYADLSGANFAGATFNNTTLTDVYITNTDFRGANMESIIGTLTYKNTI